MKGPALLRTADTSQVLGKCLDIYAAGTANGTTVELYGCNGTGAQDWVPQSNGSLVTPNSGKCLDDASPRTQRDHIPGSPAHAKLRDRISPSHPLEDPCRSEDGFYAQLSSLARRSG